MEKRYPAACVKYIEAIKLQCFNSETLSKADIGKKEWGGLKLATVGNLQFLGGAA